MTAFTPGPWVVSTEDRADERAYGFVRAGERTIAHEPWAGSGPGRAQWVANARLIAAAPALYEALYGILFAEDGTERAQQIAAAHAVVERVRVGRVVR